ncbi:MULTISPECIES: AI-2E family transporter [unclassified Haladaptatus]|uniref:AI-2E family transporter n=1 Tax=unclassified Haladaptatus TaxID=2622732 RepID=UPI0023E7AD7F|nr:MULTISPECIES: AI-2E family transporter [unclassified Haladaptatus]
MVASSVSRSRAAWWAVGAILGAALLFVLYSFIGTFVFGIFIYYATRPIYDRLKTRIYPRSLAAFVALFTLALPALLLLAYSVAIGLQEVNAIQDSVELGPLSTAVEPYLDVSSVVDDPVSYIESDTGIETLRGIMDQALDYTGFIGNLLLHLFVMIALAFYLLRDGHKLTRWCQSRFGDERGVLDSYLKNVDQDFHSIFFGNILNAVLTAIIAVLSYSVLDFISPPGLAIPYAALIGLLAGVASLIPVVGMKLVYFPVTAYLAVMTAVSEEPQFWFVVVFAAVSFVIVDTLPDFVLRPYVSGRNLHVGAVMFAYIFGPLLFSWYGIFLGPILLVLVVHFARIILPELISGTEIKPYAVDPTYLTDARKSKQPTTKADASTDGGTTSGQSTD